MSVSLPWVDAFEISTIAGILDRYAASVSTGMVLVTASTNQGIEFNQNFSPYFEQQFAAETTVIVGINFKTTAFTNANIPIIQIKDGSTVQIYVRFNTDYTLSVVRGDGTVLQTSSALTQKLIDSIASYIEFKTTINNTTGAYELKVNESSWMSTSGQNTRNSSNNQATAVRILAQDNHVVAIVDDFYISGGSVASPLNTFWGCQKIEHLRPNGPGTYSQFSRGGVDYGANYREVQDTAQDGDATYVEYATAGGKDSYTLYDMAGTPSEIRYLQGSMYARKQDTLDRQNQFLLIVGGSEYLTCSEVLSTSYAFYKCGWQTDAATGLPFGYAGTRGVNNLELGSKILV